MCIKPAGINTGPQFFSNQPAGPAAVQPPAADFKPKEILSRDAFFNKNVIKPAPIPAIMQQLSVSGQPASSSLKINLLNSASYKTEISTLLTDMHSDLKAVNKITDKQLNDVRNFNTEQRDMFLTALDQLDLLKAGKITAADHMINIMQRAADLSGNDNKKFVKLVGEAFSDIPIPLDPFRKILGAGPHTAGNLLEPLLDKIVEQQGGNFGFNANITDDIDPNNTMTHHAGEFLQVGFKRGNFLGKLAANIIDRNTLIIQDKKNEGDIRSGAFSTMIGAALKDGTIKPRDAVNLFSFAFREQPGGKFAPPYGAAETAGKHLKFKDYKIENWINSYNKAFPEQPIK